MHRCIQLRKNRRIFSVLPCRREWPELPLQHIKQLLGVNWPDTKLIAQGAKWEIEKYL